MIKIKNCVNLSNIFKMITIIIMIVIFMFSSQNGTQSSQISGSLQNSIIELLKEYIKIPQAFWLGGLLIRKAAHISIYFLLSISFYIGFTNNYEKLYKRNLNTALFSILYSMTDEFHQTFVVGRSGRISDVFIDFLGCVIALIICSFCSKYIIKNKYKDNKL